MQDQNYYHTKSQNETENIGGKISNSIQYGSTVFLIGDLASGKTTFTKGFVKGLGFKSKVQSPTFPILNEYTLNDKFIFHFDLYRLKSISEFLEIGGLEYLANKNGICLIEWPELINSLDFEKKIEINFIHLQDNEREIRISV